MAKRNIVADALAYFRNQRKAQSAINYAIQRGNLIRPDTCELCGATPAPFQVNANGHKPHVRSSISAHHWRGYEEDAIFDIWWLCHSCNHALPGPEFHNGSVTKEEAQAIIESRRV